jgi:hypothetical protein
MAALAEWLAVTAKISSDAARNYVDQHERAGHGKPEACYLCAWKTSLLARE